MDQAPAFTKSPIKASSITGTKVGNSRGERLGEIKELVIEPQHGKVAYAVVSMGGFLGLGEKLFAVPFSAFEYDRLNNEYFLEIPRERLRSAPGFDPQDWPLMSDEKWNREVCGFYGRTPYWE